MKKIAQLKIIAVLFTFLAVSYSAGPAFGQTAKEAAATLEEIVVTGTRYEEKISLIPANITIIKEADIQGTTAQNIPEILRNQAGIQINDITGNQRSYTVDLRGFGETAALNTLVLVDGRRVNQADLSGADWSQIPLERIERIEIIRGGSGSVLYGDNASGGVINIITKSGRELKKTVEAGYGSYDTLKTGASLSGSTEKLTYYLSGRHGQSRGYRANSATNTQDAGVDLNHYLTDSFKVNISGGYHKDKTGLPGALKESDFAAGRTRRDTIYPQDFAQTEDYYLKAAPEIYLLEDSLAKVDISLRRRNSLSHASGSWGDFTGDTLLSSWMVSPQVVLKYKGGKIRNSLTIGMDYQQYKQDITNDSTFFGSRTVQLYNLQKDSYGYYLHDELGLSPRFSLSGGLRQEQARYQFTPGTPREVSVNRTAATIGANYTYQGQSYAYLSYANGFRYPVLDEFFSFFTNTVDTTLVPQTSENYELGLRHYLTGKTYVHLNGFLIETKKEIFYNPNSWKNENIDGRTRRQGVEAAFFAKLTGNLAFNGSYTYTSARIEEGQFKDRDIPGVARHKAALGLTYSPLKALRLGLNGIYRGRQIFISDFDNSFGEMEDYTVVNGRIEYQHKQFTTYLNVNNIADTRYSEYGAIGGFPAEKGYYPSPGRNIFAGVTLNF